MQRGLLIWRPILDDESSFRNGLTMKRGGSFQLSCFTDQSLPASDDVQHRLREAAGVSEAFRTVTSPPPSLEESLHHRPVLLVPVHQKEDPSVKKRKKLENKEFGTRGQLDCVVFKRLDFSNGMPEHGFLCCRFCSGSGFLPICLALIEIKLNYEKNNICIFVQQTVTSYPCACFACAHLKNDLHDCFRGIAASTALLVLLFPLSLEGNTFTPLTLCVLAFFCFWFAPCMYISASASVFLAAGLSYFPRFSSQCPSVLKLWRKWQPGGRAAGWRWHPQRFRNRRKRGVKCEAELNDLGAAGSLQEAKWPSVVLHTQAGSAPAPAAFTSERTVDDFNHWT